MQLADLMPSGRRASAAPSEPAAAATADAVPGLPRRSSTEGSFSEVLAGSAQATTQEILPLIDSEPAAQTPDDLPEPLITVSMTPCSEIVVETRKPAETSADAPLPVPDPEAQIAPALLPRPKQEEPGSQRPAPQIPTAAAALQTAAAAPDKIAVEPEAEVSADDASPTAPASHTPSGGVAASPLAVPAAAAAVTPLAPAADAPVLAWRLEAESPVQASVRAELPAPATTPQPATRQIAAAVAQAGGGMVEIRLDPPELGRVQIRLEPAEDGLRAVVLAERADTQDLLRRNADQLARELAEAGYARVSLDFAAGGERARRDDRPTHGFTLAATAPIDLPASIHLPTRSAPPQTSGLDVRL